AGGGSEGRRAMKPSTAHATAVPTKTPRNDRLSTTTLIDCIAAIPCAAGRRCSAPITKEEKAKKTPAMTPGPRAARRVRTKRGMGGAGRSPLLGRGPGGVGIIAGHLCCLGRRVGSQVLLQDDPRLVDQKRLHSRRGVSGRVRHQGEAIDH